MKLIPAQSPNYCATICVLGPITQLEAGPDGQKKCDNVVGSTVLGNRVVVTKSSQQGDLGVYFPVESQLDEKFVFENNLNADATLNKDKTKKGYISKGRVRCVAFQGHRAEGLFLPISCLDFFTSNCAGSSDCYSKLIGQDFEAIEANGVVQPICKKYIPGGTVKQIRSGGGTGLKYNQDQARVRRVINEQFHLHCDTENLKKNVGAIRPDDIISITNKKHGTSAVTGRVLVKRKRSAFENFCASFKALERLAGPELEYGLVFSSRSVVKNVYFESKVDQYDLWALAANQVSELLPDGTTLYYEIIGYYPSGKAIQSGYGYNCKPGEFEIEVYRITQINHANVVTELSYGQLKDFCNAKGLNHVEQFYYGAAKDVFPEIPVNEFWSQNFLARLQTSFNLEKPCKDNDNKVPAEGIVVRIDNLFKPMAYKLKAYAFLKKETKDLDAGIVDTETEQSLGEQ